jgi:hypothetical protein
MALLVSSLLVGVPSEVQAGSINITINDGLSPAVGPATGKGLNRGGEDQEVEPGNTWNQAWELEGFFYNPATRTLSMVGGFNFKTGFSDGGDTYLSGHIFIDVDGVPRYGSNATDNGIYAGGYQKIKNTYGYDYALIMNFGKKTYDVYKITADSFLKGVDLSRNDQANPFQLAKKNGQYTGELVGTGTLLFTKNLSDAQTGFSGGSHYQVDLEGLSQSINLSDAYFHFTMGCGNDSLMGHYQVVPIPGSWLLLGSGLVGLWGFRRRFRRG